jgi:hypothetical protein
VSQSTPSILILSGSTVPSRIPLMAASTALARDTKSSISESFIPVRFCYNTHLLNQLMRHLLYSSTTLTTLLQSHIITYTSPPYL